MTDVNIPTAIHCCAFNLNQEPDVIAAYSSWACGLVTGCRNIGMRLIRSPLASPVNLSVVMAATVVPLRNIAGARRISPGINVTKGTPIRYQEPK